MQRLVKLKRNLASYENQKNQFQNRYRSGFRFLGDTPSNQYQPTQQEPGI